MTNQSREILQLLLQELFLRVTGLGESLSRHGLAVSRLPQAVAGLGLMEGLGHVLLQDLHAL